MVVDDLQWLDRASSLVLASAVRRLAGTGVGFLAALRTESESFFDRAGLPSYEIEPLDRAAATALLKQRFPALTPPVRERLIADAQGNPLALLELPIALRDARPARPHLGDALPLTARLQALFACRITKLPAPTIALLLIAVLDGTGDLRYWRQRPRLNRDSTTSPQPNERASSKLTSRMRDWCSGTH